MAAVVSVVKGAVDCRRVVGRPSVVGGRVERILEEEGLFFISEF